MIGDVLRASSIDPRASSLADAVPGDGCDEAIAPCPTAAAIAAALRRRAQPPRSSPRTSPAEDMRRAFAKFVTDVIELAERWAIEAIENAFHKARSTAVPAVRRSSPGSTARAVRDERPPPTAPPGNCRPLSPNDVGMRAHVAALIRQRPGMRTKQLATALSVNTDQLRRFLEAMVLDNEIRFDEITVGALRRRTYYVVDHSHGIEHGVGAETVSADLRVGAMG